MEMDKDLGAKGLWICYKQIQQGFLPPNEATSYHLTLQFLYKSCSALVVQPGAMKILMFLTKIFSPDMTYLLSNNLVPRSLDLGDDEKQNWIKVQDWGQETSSIGWSSLAKCGPWVSNAGSQGQPPRSNRWFLRVRKFDNQGTERWVPGFITSNKEASIKNQK